MHERCRLQHVAGAFTTQLRRGAPAQLLIHDRYQLVSGASIARRPGQE